MFYTVIFEKGRPGTSRTPSQRQLEDTVIETDSDDVEVIKRLAQLQMRKEGKKGFHYRSHHAKPDHKPKYILIRPGDEELEEKLKLTRMELKMLYNLLVDTYHPDMIGYNSIRQRIKNML